MSHFASATLPSNFGRVASTRSAAQANQASTAAGTLSLAYSVPADGAGLYLVAAAVRTTTASTAATSHYFLPKVAWNDGTAQSAATFTLGGVAASNFSLKSTAGTPYSAWQILYAAASTTITVSSAEAVTGTGTGAADVEFAVVRIG